jgi:hypothetical protein
MLMLEKNCIFNPSINQPATMIPTPHVSKEADQEVTRTPLYTFADGILDVAYEEIAEAKANCFRAWYNNKITKEVYDLAKKHFKIDYDKIGRIPYEELQELIARYAKQNKSMVYQFIDLEIVC